MHKIFNFDYSPSFVMADCADEISNAIKKVFPNATRLTCWAHAQRGFSNHWKFLAIEKDTRNEIEQDIYKLQLSHSVINFEVNYKLFKKKWSDRMQSIDVFLDYFEKEYITSAHSTWYEGIAPHRPSTNNALEAVNNSIKATHTLRQRENLSHFLSKVCEILNDWSLDREHGTDQIKFFYETPEINAELWQQADTYIKENPSIKHIKSQECFLVSRREVDSQRVRFYYKKIECDTQCDCFEDFDDYVLLHHEVKKVELNEENWSLSRCTCYDFFKKLICKHIVTVAVSNNRCSIDYSFQNIGAKKKPGRKKKTKSCWERQIEDF